MHGRTGKGRVVYCDEVTGKESESYEGDWVASLIAKPNTKHLNQPGTLSSAGDGFRCLEAWAVPERNQKWRS